MLALVYTEEEKLAYSGPNIPQYIQYINKVGDFFNVGLG